MTRGNAENHYNPSDLTIDLMTGLKSLGPSLKSLVPSRKQVASHLNGDSSQTPSLKSLTRVLSSAVITPKMCCLIVKKPRFVS
jgi:hypothetical protein